MRKVKFILTIFKILFVALKFVESSDDDTLEQVLITCYIAYIRILFSIKISKNFANRTSIQYNSLIQLIIGYTNVPLDDDIVGADIVIDEGMVPNWIEGSFVRHTCMAFGETEHASSEYLNRVTHQFDCIPGAQSYSFHNGKITYNSQYWDTNQVKKLYFQVQIKIKRNN